MRGLVGLVLLVGLLVGCGDSTGDPAGVREPTGTPRSAVFEPGQLVWAQRSTVHVGDTTYDVSPQLVRSMSWTPYGLYLEVTQDPNNGPFHEVFYVGAAMEPVNDVYTNLITSPDGELAAWIERNGPKRPSGRVAQVVVVDTRTGGRIYESADGMGGEEGDDLADLYEELPPSVIDLTDDQLVWRNSAGSGAVVTTDLRTGESTASDDEPDLKPTSGYEYWSPDGRYRVDATTTGKLRVRHVQVDFGHRFQTQGGWLDDHTMLVLAQDHYPMSFDPTVPDTTPGFLLACDLDAGTCEQLAEVEGAREVAFPGVDAEY
ncbi:hypothetical protein GCM10023350_21580 [Nocardioides endophyticus]|uniref:Uncharacterized protein n=1 Tax=Nocardioides endophyticus TaxID=1353775 RepID=A0ABP8YS72_9ACTN